MRFLIYDKFAGPACLCCILALSYLNRYPPLERRSRNKRFGPRFAIKNSSLAVMTDKKHIYEKKKRSRMNLTTHFIPVK